MATLMNKTNNGWSLYDGNGNLVLTIEDGKVVCTNVFFENEVYMSGQGYQTNLKTMLERLSQRIYSLETCLRGDTQILMADCTTKDLKDVKYGDMVMGWDLDNHCLFPIKSYGAFSTGRDNVWQYHVFNNGQILEISHTHGIYSKTKGRCSNSGAWIAGEIGIGVDGNDVMLAYVDKVEEANYSDQYTMVTENNTYFANGILCANNPSTKMRYYSVGMEEYNKNITKEDLEFFKMTADQSDDSQKLRFSTQAYLKESAPYYAELHDTKHHITLKKREIAAGDYKTTKYTEGKLTEEEFTTHCVEAQAIREEINQLEAKRDALIATIKGIQKKHEVIPAEDPSKRWKRLYDLDMKYIKANRK